jgi:hypothetical protein
MCLEDPYKTICVCRLRVCVGGGCVYVCVRVCNMVCVQMVFLCTCGVCVWEQATCLCCRPVDVCAYIYIIHTYIHSYVMHAIIHMYLYISTV